MHRSVCVLVLISTLAFVGCGKSGGGGGGGKGSWTQASLLAAAEDTANRICACPDPDCLGKIEMEPKDPLFGHSTRDFAEKMPAEAKATWDALVKKGMTCKVETLKKAGKL
jgi:hypothetical protein